MQKALKVRLSIMARVKTKTRLILHHFSKKNGAGFTLIELVIAVGVFTVGIMGAFTLALADLKVAKDNFNRVLAADLAREGIELIRNIRDSNWLKIDANVDCDSIQSGLQLCAWDQDFNTANFFVVNYTILNSTNNINPVCGGSTGLNDCILLSSGIIQPVASQLYLDGSGFYNHSPVGTPTNFHRVIQVQSICFTSGSESIQDGPTCGSGEKTGVKVTSRVAWFNGSKIDKLDVIEYLYNWRR